MLSELRDVDKPNNKEIEAVINFLPTKKIQKCKEFITEFYQDFREDQAPVILRLFHEIESERHFQTHSLSQHYFKNKTRATQKKKTTSQHPL